jgi:hypothetical protein
VQHLHEVAYDYVSRGRVEVAANPAATKTQQPDQLSRIKTTQSVMPTERATFFNNIGHEPPRQPKSLAAAIPLITDAKADDRRGGSGPEADIIVDVRTKDERRYFA